MDSLFCARPEAAFCGRVRRSEHIFFDVERHWGDAGRVKTAAELLDEAARTPFQGWDFSLLGSRLVVEPPPWPFGDIVTGLMDHAEVTLDMGTGGGEWLSTLPRRSAAMVATESWPPNVPVAAARLRPLAVCVVHDEGAVDNVAQHLGQRRGRLAFRDGAFDLVVNRHESFVAEEVRRVLRPGGIFVTQQADSGSRQLHELLGLQAPKVGEFRLELAIEQITDAGLHLDESGVGLATTTFRDIGALAWYLSAVPWAVPRFSIAECHDALVNLHGRTLSIPSLRFWLRAHN
jgi:SAM-dependent methyltransferase